MRTAAGISAMAFALLTSACHQITPQEVLNDARQVAKVGMPIEAASSALSAEGFRCGPKDLDIKADLECDRDGGSGNMLAGCIQRVFIDLDAKRRVSHIHNPSVMCAGM